MKEELSQLLNHLETQGPPISIEELEEKIARCLAKKMGDSMREITTSEDFVFFTQSMQDKFGLSCEVAPALSLYVNVANKSSEEVPVEVRAPLPFEQTLDVIGKDMESRPAEETIRLTENAINSSCEYFLNAVILSHPILMKIFKHLQNAFQLNMAIVVKLPVEIVHTVKNHHDHDASATRPGMYL